MSQTEQEALSAGSVWWDREIFSGNPDWNKLYSLPHSALSAEEQAFLDGPVQELCEMLNDWDITNERNDLPPEVWSFIKDNGFLSMIIPKAYGGLEFSALAHSEVVMKVATRSITAAVTIMVPNSLGPGKLLLHYGTQEQKDHFLPRLATGTEIPCFALTGPNAGSDAGSIPDTGIVCRGEHNGEMVLGIRLNWEKRYITLGPVATILGLAFKLYDPNKILGDKHSLGITVALIPTNHPGVEIGARHNPLNLAFMNGPNYGKEVFIPMEWIIGGQPMIGKGWKMLVECLSDGRAISLPSLSAGGAKLVCQATGAYSRIRKQFNMPIGKMEGVEEALGRIAGNAYVIDSGRKMTILALDMGIVPSVLSGVIKYHATEKMRKVINDAMDVQGGSGICLGPQNLIGRVYQSIPVSITVEGANILTRTMIIFGQGAMRAHPYVLQEVIAAQENDAAKFDEAFTGHVKFVVRNFFHTITCGVFQSPAVGQASAQEKKYIKQITRLSSAFALVADITLLMLGGALKRKERISARLGDILSGLYLATACIKNHNNQKQDTGLLLDWACQQLLFDVQEAFYDLFDNYPNKVVGKILKAMVFPFGRRFKKPSDKLDQKLARIITTFNEIRDLLIKGTFISNNPTEQTHKLEYALFNADYFDEKEQYIRKQVKLGITTADKIHAAWQLCVISREERDTLMELYNTHQSIIKVDSFTK